MMAIMAKHLLNKCKQEEWTSERERVSFASFFFVGSHEKFVSFFQVKRKVSLKNKNKKHYFKLF